MVEYLFTIRVLETICNHLRYLLECFRVKTPCGHGGSAQANPAGDKGGLRIKGDGVFVDGHLHLADQGISPFPGHAQGAHIHEH